MKKIMLCVLCLVGLCAFATKAFAGDDYQFSVLTKDGFTAVFQAKVAVFDEDPGYTCERNEKGRYLLRYRENPAAFQGAKVYALGTQTNWVGGKPINTVGLERALGVATVEGGQVTIGIRNELPEAKAHDQPVTWVIVLANGKKGWLGHPGWPDGKFVVYNKSNEPQTWFVLDNVKGKVFPPDDESRAKAKKRR